MEPTFNYMGDIVITDKFSYRFLNKPRRGDVVLCTAPHDASKTVVKRILAVVGTILAKWLRAHDYFLRSLEKL